MNAKNIKTQLIRPRPISPNPAHCALIFSLHFPPCDNYIYLNVLISETFKPIRRAWSRSCPYCWAGVCGHCKQESAWRSGKHHSTVSCSSLCSLQKPHCRNSPAPAGLSMIGLFYTAKPVQSRLGTPGHFTVLSQVACVNRGGQIPRSTRCRLSTFTGEGGAAHGD